MTGSLQIKGGKYYAVLNLKDRDEKRKSKWLPTKFEVKGNKKRAEKVLRELLEQYENEDFTSANKKYCLQLSSNHGWILIKTDFKQPHMMGMYSY